MFYQIIFIFIILLSKAIKPYLKTSISNIELIIMTSIITIIILSIYLFFKSNYNIPTIMNNFIELTPKEKLIITLIALFSIITTWSIYKLYENNSIFNTNLIIKSLSTISTIVIGYLFFNEVFTYIKFVGIGIIIIGIYIISE